MAVELPIVFRRSARTEFNKARRWYNQQRDELGDEFVECVDTLLTRIRKSPTLYAIAYKNVRRAPVARFPYVVYYWVESDRVVVASVLHGRMDTEDWKSED